MMSAHLFRRSKVREGEQCMHNSFGSILRMMTADELILSVRLATAGKVLRTVERIGSGPCDQTDGYAAKVEHRREKLCNLVNTQDRYGTRTHTVSGGVS